MALHVLVDSLILFAKTSDNSVVVFSAVLRSLLSHCFHMYVKTNALDARVIRPEIFKQSVLRICASDDDSEENRDMPDIE